jgi:hypothetical protein
MLVPARRRRSSRSRYAALLVVVWGLSGVWAVGHALEHAHAMEHESGEHFAEVPGGSDVSLCVSHDQGHAHPDSPPAVSTAKAPEFDAPDLVADAPEVVSASALRRWFTRIVPARASSRTAASSGPRAPPIS